MTRQYLLDTNIISEPLRPKPSNSVMRRLREHEDDIAIPAPVWHELRFGCERLAPSRQREAIERYIEDVVLASFQCWSMTSEPPTGMRSNGRD